MSIVFVLLELFVRVRGNATGVQRSPSKVVRDR